MNTEEMVKVNKVTCSGCGAVGQENYPMIVPRRVVEHFGDDIRTRHCPDSPNVIEFEPVDTEDRPASEPGADTEARP